MFLLGLLLKIELSNEYYTYGRTQVQLKKKGLGNIEAKPKEKIKSKVSGGSWCNFKHYYLHNLKQSAIQNLAPHKVL